MKQLSKLLGDLNVISSNPKQIKKIKKDITIETKDELVVQHNSLIEARYKLSLQEKRVILWLLTQIKPEDEDFRLHRLEITEFTKMVNIVVDNRYSELRNITKRLIQRAIEIYDHQSCEFVQFSWLSSARYQIKKGCILLEFSPQLKPYLLQLKSQFTKLSVGDIMQLNSIYSMRFYELLKQYEFIGKRDISVKDLRECCGIPKTGYKRYNDFKKDVLERAKKEINEKTDITIDYQEIKQSRKIVNIKWTIHKKNLKKQEYLEKLNILQKELRSEQIIISNLLEYGFGKIVAKRLITIHGEEVVKNAIRAVDIQIEKGKAKNPKAMIQTAIQEKWHPEIFQNKKIKS